MLDPLAEPRVPVALRDQVLQLLVELLASASGDLVAAALRLARRLVLAFPWRLSFATGGGVRAILSCMQQFSSNAPVQQLALAVRPDPRDLIETS